MLSLCMKNWIFCQLNCTLVVTSDFCSLPLSKTKSYLTFLIHNASFSASFAALYSTLQEGNEVAFCFLLDQVTRTKMKHITCCKLSIIRITTPIWICITKKWIFSTICIMNPLINCTFNISQNYLNCLSMDFLWILHISSNQTTTKHILGLEWVK